MKSLNQPEINKHRIWHPYGMGDETCGAFLIREKGLTIIASNEGGWDHVSVSRRDRIPNWEEMRFIKKLFFNDEETVIQFHPPESVYKNMHPFCLHLWRPQFIRIELPPEWMV